MSFPDWVEQHKKTGCEIKCIGAKYYLYERKSQWDPIRKKAKKKTGEYLGTITPTGFIPKKLAKPDNFSFSSKEYGSTAYLTNISADIHEILVQEFPDRIGEMIYALAILRVKGEDSFKRMEIQYQSSFLSNSLPGLSMSGSSITSLLETVGRRRDSIVTTMNRLSSSIKNIIIDGSRLTSWSNGITQTGIGHNSSGSWDPQVNIMYVFERAQLPQPVFYRCVRGNIPDVSAMKLTMESMGLNYNYTVVADTGFASAENFKLMDEWGMEYIVPLKRNTTEVTAKELRLRDNYRIAFSYNNRSVIAYEAEKQGYRVLVFRDESMRSKEMSDFITRMEKKNLSIQESKRKAKGSEIDIGKEVIDHDPYFGTIIIRTNMRDNPKEIYEIYKMRVSIEQCFDTLKNTLNQDSSYMHSDESFEAWCFINHIALTIAYRILNTLKAKGLTKRFSLKDIITYLSKIHKIKFGQDWKIAEYTKKTSAICELLGFDISS
jgi:transposase